MDEVSKRVIESIEVGDHKKDTATPFGITPRQCTVWRNSAVRLVAILHKSQGGGGPRSTGTEDMKLVVKSRINQLNGDCSVRVLAKESGVPQTTMERVVGRNLGLGISMKSKCQLLTIVHRVKSSEEVRLHP